MLTFIPKSDFDASSFNNSILILPALNNIANIGQLTIDLLITSLNLNRVGYFDSPYLLPIIGSNPYGNDSNYFLATNIEIYQSEDKSISIIQIRSPVISKHGNSMVKDIFEWIKSINFKTVLLLSGADSSRGNDKLLESNRLKIMKTDVLNQDKEFSSKIEALEWNKIELSPEDLKENTNYDTYTSVIEMDNGFDVTPPEKHENNPSPLIPGCGFAYKFYETCREGQIPLLFMMWFTVEGDNVADAFLLAKEVGKLLNKEDIKWLYPKSWKFLFGGLALSSLYTS